MALAEAVAANVFSAVRPEAIIVASIDDETAGVCIKCAQVGIILALTILMVSLYGGKWHS